MILYVWFLTTAVAAQTLSVSTSTGAALKPCGAACSFSRECEGDFICAWGVCQNYMDLSFNNKLNVSDPMLKDFPDEWGIEKDGYGKSNRAFVLDPLAATLGKNDTVCEVLYPAYSRNPSAKERARGGTAVYTQPADLSQATHLTLEYLTLFPNNFQFVLGGKLPGFYGGRQRCSGGDKASDCFSTRYMWRDKGQGEAYLYLDKKAQVDDFCTLVENSDCNDKFGYSIGRGLFTFQPGKWKKLRQEITLNTFTNGQANADGIIKVFHDGLQQPAFIHDKVKFRTVETVKPKGIVFETFFGGSKDKFNNPRGQFAYFKEFKLGWH